MKKKEIVVVIAAALLCIGAWAFRPSFFEKDNGIIYVKTYDNSDNISNIYNTTAQSEIYNNIEALKKKNTYTIEDPLLIYNPYGTNTQSMYVYFTTTEKASISYTIHVEDEEIADYSNTISSTKTTTHEFQLLGLIPQRYNTITFHVTYEDGRKQDYAYSYLMSGLLGDEEIVLAKSEGESKQAVSDGLYVILGNDSSKQDFLYLYDNNGILRGEIPIEEYRAHRLLFQNDKMYYSYNKTKIAEMNTLGQITKTYDLGDYELHHDYVFDDDGNIVILATDTTSDTQEDRIISLNLSTSKVTLLCDLGDLLEDYKATTTKGEDRLDWIHINTIQWLGNDDIVISSRETSTIIKINDVYNTPSIQYMIAEESFWKGSAYEALLLKKNGEFASQSGQHSVTYVEDKSLPDGQYYLYMFNNNYGYSTTNPGYDWQQIDGCVVDKSSDLATSYYYKYLVDETNGTYTLVDQFAVPFSAYVSSVQDVSSTTIVDSGTAKNFQEYDSEHQLIQSFSMEAENFIYRVYKYRFDGFYFHK